MRKALRERKALLNKSISMVYFVGAFCVGADFMFSKTEPLLAPRRVARTDRVMDVSIKAMAA